MKPETRLYLAISSWLQMQHKGVIFHFDMKLQSMGAGALNARMNPFNGYPDLFIAQRSFQGEYLGLYIEIKVEGTRLKKKNGDWVNDHVKTQAEMLEKLYKKGFKAEFGIGLQNCMDIINDYLTP